MTHVFRAAVCVLTMGAATGAAAQQQPVPPATTTQPPSEPPAAGPAPATPGQQPPAPGAPVPAAPAPPAAVPAPTAAPGCPAPIPPATAPARAFGSQTGILLHPVLSTRVADFEVFLRYVRDALAKTTNATVRKQASGWKFFRMAEPGPNGDIVYVFLLDPAVPCVDYALGPIIAEVYPDPAQLQEIWKLYTGSVRSGGTIMNLVPLPVAAPPAVVPVPGSSTAPPASAPAGTPAAPAVGPGAPSAPPPTPADPVSKTPPGA